MVANNASLRQNSDDELIEDAVQAEPALSVATREQTTGTDSANDDTAESSGNTPLAPVDTPNEQQAANELPHTATTDQQPIGFAPGVEKRKPPVFKGENRRQHQRCHIVLPYTMAYEDPRNPKARCHGYTEDLSVGGVSITSSVNIPLGSPVAIRLEIVLYGMNTHVVSTGKIVNHTFSSSGGGFRYGIQFMNIRDEYRHTIEKLQHAMNKRML